MAVDEMVYAMYALARQRTFHAVRTEPSLLLHPLD